MNLRLALTAVLVLLGGVACRGPRVSRSPVPAVRTQHDRQVDRTTRLGYSIQAGAFAQPENAARFAERLRDAGLEATHFKGQDGLFRVRFGDFPSRAEARARATQLVGEGVIEAFLVVAPEVGARAALPDGVRQDLVRTAEDFLGVPYLWGGTSAEDGFDCSGLVQAVFRLNGMGIPRSSGAQFEAGQPVDLEDAQPGDLVFFAMRGSRVDHVGLYVGQGEIIHAPGRGRHICRADLGSTGMGRQVVGVRTFIP